MAIGEPDVYPQCLFVLLDSSEGFCFYARDEEGVMYKLVRAAWTFVLV